METLLLMQLAFDALTVVLFLIAAAMLRSLDSRLKALKRRRH